MNINIIHCAKRAFKTCGYGKNFDVPETKKYQHARIWKAISHDITKKKNCVGKVHTLYQ